MEIWHILQKIEVVVLSHTEVATSLSLAQSLNPNIGMETLERLRTVCNLISKEASKSFDDPSRLNGKRYILQNGGRIL
jgi:hypothetical protein